MLKQFLKNLSISQARQVFEFQVSSFELGLELTSAPKL